MSALSRRQPSRLGASEEDRVGRGKRRVPTSAEMPRKALVPFIPRIGDRVNAPADQRADRVTESVGRIFLKGLKGVPIRVEKGDVRSLEKRRRDVRAP